MKDLIIKEIQNYGSHLINAHLCEVTMHNCPPACQRESEKQHLERLKLKVGVIECWIGLLKIDQRHIIEDHLIRGLDWASTTARYNARWDGMHNRSTRTLMKYQAAALDTITDFQKAHVGMERWSYIFSEPPIRCDVHAE